MPRETFTHQTFDARGNVVAQTTEVESDELWRRRETQGRATAAIALLTADIAQIDGTNWAGITTLAQLRGVVQSLAQMTRRNHAATRALLRLQFQQFDQQDGE